MKYLKKFIIWIWDFVFFFVSAPYEVQATKLKLDKADPFLRGPDNPKPTYQVFRANKVSRDTKV